MQELALEAFHLGHLYILYTMYTIKTLTQLAKCVDFNSCRRVKRKLLPQMKWLDHDWPQSFTLRTFTGTTEQFPLQIKITFGTNLNLFILQNMVDAFAFMYLKFKE